MGTDVHVVVVGGRVELLELAREVLDDLESRWSRFRPASEVSLMNLMAGYPVRVSAPTLELVSLALEGVRITRSRFDPTVLGDVIRAGYDRSFELLAAGTAGGRSDLRRGSEAIVVDPVASTVTIPTGVGFDPGGIGKGYAADLVVAALLDAGAEGVCANVGGDLRVEGRPPDGSWAVAVAHPLRAESTTVLSLRRGAVATSTRTRRTWGPPHDRRHHLIDPATGRPAGRGVASATAVAARGWQAEVLSKAAFVSGVEEGIDLLTSMEAEGLFVDDAGGVHRSPGLDRFTAERERAVAGEGTRP